MLLIKEEVRKIINLSETNSDELEKLIRQKAAEKAEADAALIVRG